MARLTQQELERHLRGAADILRSTVDAESLRERSCAQMALKEAEVRGFRPSAVPFKKADRKGLHIEVFLNCSKLWQVKYRIAGKEKRLSPCQPAK